MTRIVVIGECMVELAPVGEALYRMGFAGDTFNTAWHLRYLVGQEVAIDYLTTVGDDPSSSAMTGFMRQSGLGTDWIRQVQGAAPGLYMIRQENGDRAFSYWRDTSAARRLADDAEHLQQALAGADFIYLSGITLAILSPTARETLWGAIDATSAQVIFDPNIRPRLWHDDATCRAALMEAAGFASSVLPSFGDEQLLFGDLSPRDTLRRYAAAGASEIVVKDADRAAIVAVGSDIWEVAPTALSHAVVDATGAGDAFNAGWLAARLGGVPAPEAAEAAHRHAARILGVAGALLTDCD